ncbi:PAS domain-containing protein [Emticicia oligotrophica]|uniref:PAS domain-containing sensor histidine kinase n=1 Tax=Emticicia oligotrophica TaxID=312279 RepID=UPI00273C5DAA|nr:PAS domain-containing protein [Emticicia oligotrophica]
MDNLKMSSSFGLSLIGKKVESLVKILPQLIYVLDLEKKNLVFISDRITDILGYSKEEIVEMGNSLGPIMVHTNKAAFAVDISRQFNELKFGDNLEFMMAFLHKNGEVRTLKNTANLIEQNAEGKNHYVMLIAEDITEQIIREEILQFKQQYIQDSERAFQYGSWEMEAGSDYVSWTDGLFEILSIPKNRFPDGKVPYGYYLSFVPLEERETLEREVNTNINERKPYSEYAHTIIDAVGNTKYVILRMHLFVSKGTTIIMGTVIDNTLSFTAEKERNDYMIQLQRQHTQMEEAESIFKFGSWECNINESYFSWSEGLFKLLELDSQKYPSGRVGLDFYDNFVHPDDEVRIREYTRQVLVEKRPFYEIEHRIIDAKGTLKNILLRARIQYNENGRLLRAVGVTADLTEIETYRRELERQVVALNRSNQELEQFAYVASHDLQEPLRKIKAFGERLERKYKEIVGEEGSFFIERMINAAQRMNTLIDDLLTYSRASRGVETPKKIALNEVVKQVIDDLEIKIQNENAKIIVGDLPIVEAQQVQMQQLFQNLIDNALKFRKPNVSPVVQISVRKLSKTEILKLTQLKPTLEYYEFVISDNGIGFEPKYTEQIFAIFQRLHGRAEYAGTGLGLAICRKIVEAYQGYIMAKGEEGIGATFIFYLPTTKS